VDCVLAATSLVVLDMVLVLIPEEDGEEEDTAVTLEKESR